MAETGEVSQDVGVRDLLEAGLHFGHQTKRWNPKMKRYIFDKRNGIHIIDLSKSLVMLKQALEFVNDVVLSGRSVLFVGTKKQAQQVIKTSAEGCGQHYVTNRWLGGTLTNNATIRNSIKRMKEIEEIEKNDGFTGMHKKEASHLRRELEKLRRNLGGIADMNSLPGAMFVVDIGREAIAVAEANKLNIPVIAIVDTNCDPDRIDYVVPGNDDAIRAIKLIASTIADTTSRAGAEYAKIAAERARKAEAERRAAEEKQKKEDEARKAAAEEKQKQLAKAKKAAAKEAAAKKAAAKVAAKVAAEEAKKAAAEKSAKAKADAAEEAAVEKQEKPAEEPAEKAAPAETADKAEAPEAPAAPDAVPDAATEAPAADAGAAEAEAAAAPADAVETPAAEAVKADEKPAEAAEEPAAEAQQTPADAPEQQDAPAADESAEKEEPKE